MLGVLITGGNTGVLGTALLIAAAPVGRGRLIDASSVLPALAAVPPSALTGTRAATVIELADPLDPQTVLTRVRAAARTEGPLFLYVAGQLQLDRKQRLPHVALARSAPSTLRYTGLPWHWLAAELTVRPPGTTTVIVDLIADPDAWRHVNDTGIGLGPTNRLYGRVAPPPARREEAVPAYLGAYASVWRGGSRPDLATLHEQAAIQAGVEGALLLAQEPTAVNAPGPLSGHFEAGAPEGPTPRGAAGLNGAVLARTSSPPGQPRSVGAGNRPTVALGAPDRAAPDGDRAPAGDGVADGAGEISRGGDLTARPAGASVPLAAPVGQPDRLAQPPAVVGTPPVPTAPPVSARAVDAVGSGAPTASVHDPHPAILAAARAGRHTEAAAAAAAWEQQELRAHGPGSVQAIHWLEVRADLARLAAEPGLSCELWMTVADARLARQQALDEPDVEGAVDRAHHQWEQIHDPAKARALAPRLVALRRKVPGRQRGALRVLQRRLEGLHSGRAAP